MGEKPKNRKLSKSIAAQLRSSDFAAAHRTLLSESELDVLRAELRTESLRLALRELGALGGQKRMRKLTKAERKALASKAGKARAKKLSAAKRKAIAKAAVQARERKRAERRVKP